MSNNFKKDNRNLFVEVENFKSNPNNSRFLPKTTMDCETVERLLKDAFPNCEFIPIKDLMVNKQMQRLRTNCLADKHIQDIMNAFDITKFEALIVNRFRNMNFVVEGQGRIMAFIAAYPGIESLPCVVKKVESWNEVCQTFYNIRSPKLKTAISPVDDFLTHYHQHCLREMAIMDIFKKYGLEYEEFTNTRGMVFTKNELRSLVKNYTSVRAKNETEVIHAFCSSAKGQYFKGKSTDTIFMIYYHLKELLDNANKKINNRINEINKRDGSNIPEVNYTLYDLFNKDMKPYKALSSESEDRIMFIFKNVLPKGVTKSKLNEYQRICNFVTLIQEAANMDSSVVSNEKLVKRIYKGHSRTPLEYLYESAKEMFEEEKNKMQMDFFKQYKESFV